MSLKGGADLRARIKAVRQTFRFYGRTWADTTVDEARRRVPVTTGRLQRSIKRRNANQRRATVVGHFSANFVDAGVKAHDIRPKRKPALIFEAQGRTIFAKKVHKARIPARPFKAASAHAAIRRNPMSETMIKLWNRAA